MTRITRTTLGTCFGLLLIAGCSDGSANPTDDSENLTEEERQDAIMDRAFDDYDLERAREHCAAPDNDESDTDDADDEATLGDDELLLIDASPQCDLERLGVEDDSDRRERRVINASLVADEPAYALCACTEIEASNRIETEGESDIIGDIGANEHEFGSAPLRLNGLLVSGGTARFDNSFSASELWVDGVLTASNDIDVSGDATLGGLDIPGERVTVSGALTVPEDTDLSSVVSSGDTIFDDVDVAAPCDCSNDVDYDALRERFRDLDDDGVDDYEGYDEFAYDDDSAYLFPAPPYLLNELDEERTVYLSCGSYYFEGIESAAALTIVAVGDVEIFVDGDIRVAGPLKITADDDGSLDLYVAGEVKPTNRVQFGNAGEPDALRVYVQDEVRTAGPFELHGTIFSPNAQFTADNTFQTDGAVFAESFDFAAPVTITDGPRFTGDACLLWDENDENTDVDED